MSEHITNNYETNAPDLSLSSHFALRVALQTMRERCISLQERLTLVEDENFALRNRIDIDFPSNLSEQSELNELRKQVTDLSQQKQQLADHINMVAAENRQLWSRLSQLSKERQKSNDDKMNASTSTTITSATGQNLIRSKTFTQHSPNPNLRHKHIDEDNNSFVKPLNDLSLEEVELTNYLNAKELTENEVMNKNSLGFGYLNDETGSIEGEIITESRKCIDNMHEIKKKILEQQNDLKQVLSQLEQKFVLQECQDCKKLKKPETADKSLETDDSLIEDYKNIVALTPQNSTDIQLNQSINDTKYKDDNIEIINQKILADEMDKMCPLCGKIYSSEVTFNDFQHHVETHFIDDEDLDPSHAERNFEMISHTVGDF